MGKSDFDCMMLIRFRFDVISNEVAIALVIGRGDEASMRVVCAEDAGARR